ncbi:4a-hydroxytetrahydrobiopterin dehydratase [Candidatus Pacearchaeota archaeon]|nr:4a-hydroxytetrahydrobiopterin dehydratase [Candidatus Pacearchaeota archaeon]
MLSLSEINREMSTLKSWSLEGSSITKIETFTNFKEAIDYVNKVGEIAEKHNHHPDIIINYNQVRLSLSTHSVSGLTKKDFEVAREIDGI